MGKIKSALIKKTGRQLMSEESSFSADFEHNKKLLGNTMPSKKNRNKVAGYIAKLKRKEGLQKIIKTVSENQNG